MFRRGRGRPVNQPSRRFARRGGLPSLLGAALALGLGLTSATASAAETRIGTIRVEVTAVSVPLEGVTISVGGVSARTDSSGAATLALPPGAFTIVATKVGYQPTRIRAHVVAGVERSIAVAVSPDPTHGTTMSSTRTGRPVEDQAVPVDIHGRDEIEHNLQISPGALVRSLGEIPGFRVQTTSPELGLSMARIQGLPGQYTRLLSDGLPLYFDHPGGIAPLQIPLMDLERIEVIEGSASALFGANATGGVVNLLSRRPGKERDREFLFNQSVRGGTDAVLWLTSPQTRTWGSTLLVSAHRQQENDVDDDGWSDLPGYSRGVAREGVAWTNGRGRSVWGTAGVTFEKREGGSTFAHQSLETRGADGSLSGQTPLGRYTLTGGATLHVQSRVRDFSSVREHDRAESATIELALHGSAPRQTWVAGIAADWFTIRTPTPLLSGYVAPRGGLFAHDDLQVTPWLSLSGSGRFDYAKGASEALRVDNYFFSPRGSALVHGGPWAARFSAGRSFYAPTTLMEETEGAGFTRLKIESPLHIETARSMSADLTHATGDTTVTLTLFHNHLDHPARIDRATYTLFSQVEPTVTRGVEFLARGRHAPFALTGAYTFVHARELGQDIALTPRHRARLLATAEREGRGRVGVEVAFTSTQRLEANPYRTRSEPYTLLGVFGEHRFGRWRLFVNGDNLTDVHQTHWDPIARPARDVDGRWTVDAWAPLVGRIINVGTRIAF